VTGRHGRGVCTDVGKIDRVVYHNGSPYVRARGSLICVWFDVQGNRESHVATASGHVLQEKVYRVQSQNTVEINVRTWDVTRILRTPGKSEMTLKSKRSASLDLRDNDKIMRLNVG